jgi:anti-anti-sigma factor
MSPPHPFLTIHAEEQRDAYVIALEGELDLAGCADLDLVLSEAERTRASRIILDLEELTFIDSSGLDALLAASRRSASNGNRLQLTPGNGNPADMFRLTLLDIKLPFTEPALCPAIRGTGPH